MKAAARPGNEYWLNLMPKASLEMWFQIYHHDGAGDQGGDGACRGRLFPVMSHDIWEEGTGCLNVKQNIRMDTMLCVLKRAMNMEARPTRQCDDFCNLHDGLAGCIRLQHCLIDVIGKDGATAKEIESPRLDMVAGYCSRNKVRI